MAMICLKSEGTRKIQDNLLCWIKNFSISQNTKTFGEIPYLPKQNKFKNQTECFIKKLLRIDEGNQ